ncbi:MAG: DUF4380 domain-containing protein [Spirochaetes bacterium]|nr:DUF4380 domain-containing protein [Spirochaetota bacterium]
MRIEKKTIQRQITSLPALILCVSAMVFLNACKPLSKNTSAEKSLYLLSNNDIVIGMLPEVGGRIAVFRPANGGNMIKADTDRFAEKDSERLVPPKGALKKEYREYFGNIVITGPQSRWWQEQTVFPDKKKNKGKWPWPPDPFLMFGAYKLETNTAAMVRFTGPQSPVSGVTLTREITLSGKKARVITTARNMRRENITRDLWSMTALEANTHVYIPVRGNADVRFIRRGQSTNISWEIAGSHFTCHVRQFLTNAFIESDKVFITASSGYVAVFKGNAMLLITFPVEDASAVSPEHGSIELAVTVKATPAESFLTLSHHSALATLQSGAEMTLDETWYLFPYTGNSTLVDETAFLKKTVSDLNHALAVTSDLK